MGDPMTFLGELLGWFLVWVLLVVVPVGVPLYLLWCVVRLVSASGSKVSGKAGPGDEARGGEGRPVRVGDRTWPGGVFLIGLAVVLAGPMTVDWAMEGWWFVSSLPFEPSVGGLVAGAGFAAAGFVLAVVWRSVFLTARRRRVRFGWIEVAASVLAVVAVVAWFMVADHPGDMGARGWPPFVLPAGLTLFVIYLQSRLRESGA
jgi:hypothetical protein